MVTLDQLNVLFAEKLLATNSLDAALKKVTWVAYKQGVEDGQKGIVVDDENKVVDDGNKVVDPQQPTPACKGIGGAVFDAYTILKDKRKMK